jgi:hypothetical protein
MPTAMMAVATVLTLISPQEATSLPLRTALDAMAVEHQAAWDAMERVSYDDVLVLGRGDNQAIPQCGIYASYIAVKGRLSTGETAFFYMSWCEAGQAAPPVSGRCHFDVRIDHRPPGGFVSGENDLPREWDWRFDRPYNMIERFDCMINSDSPTITPAGVNRWEPGIGNPEGIDD